jgi:hypothetical protein
MDKNTVLHTFALYLYANEKSKNRLIELNDNELLKTNISNKILIETLAYEIGLTRDELDNKKEEIKRKHNG